MFLTRELALLADFGCEDRQAGGVFLCPVPRDREGSKDKARKPFRLGLNNKAGKEQV
jgi:hypothetical protein